MQYATTVGDLIAALKQFPADKPVIGDHCRAQLVIVEQTTGPVLVAQATPEMVRPKAVPAA